MSVAASLCLLAPAASASAPDPPENLTMGDVYSSCPGTPPVTSLGCENAVIYYLDRARARMGLGPYALPADFPRLPADVQILILSNLDLVAYGEPPVAGLSAELSAAASRGVAEGGDPSPPSGSSPHQWSSNWAGAFVNAPAAYYAWLYDDGYGSGNLACRSPSDDGCWGHRHDVLGQPGQEPPAEAAMGAASGAEQGTGSAGYAQLIVSTEGQAPPPLYYSWSQALADGAGTNPYDPGVPQPAPGESPAGPGHRTPPGHAVPAPGNGWLRLARHRRGLEIEASAGLVGRRAKVTVRREVVPCALRLSARHCGWTPLGPVAARRLRLAARQRLSVRPPGAWERVEVKVRVAAFGSGPKRVSATAVGILLQGPRPHRAAR